VTCCRCGSDPKIEAGAATDAVEVDGEDPNGLVTVKLPDGAWIGVATVAGEASVADVVADAVDVLEALEISVEPGNFSDPFSFLFWVCPTLPIFWRGFAISPTF
jgi:hypothetical protein